MSESRKGKPGDLYHSIRMFFFQSAVLSRAFLRAISVCVTELKEVRACLPCNAHLYTTCPTTEKKINVSRIIGLYKLPSTALNPN